MKTLLVAVHCSHAHSSLAIPYLRAACAERLPGLPVPDSHEFLIGQSASEIAGQLAALAPDIVGFSCAIYNVAKILEVTRRLRGDCPSVVVLYGGPEMTDGGEHWLRREGGPDFVLRGEADLTFVQFLRSMARSGRVGVPPIPGLSRLVGTHFDAGPPARPVEPLDVLPSPFQAGFACVSKPFAYFESARGCPFRCRFCLSGERAGMRSFSLDRVFADLRALRERGVTQVRFLDRTFNAIPKRACDILAFIETEWPDLNVHLELEPRLLGHAPLLKQLERDRIHAEIGLQSLDPTVLGKSGRTAPSDADIGAVRRLCAGGRARVHLDLIAALPGATLQSLFQDLDVVCGLGPAEIQVEVLKLLRGTAFRGRAGQYGIRFQPEPPYAVCATDQMSTQDVRRANLVSSLVDRFYNDTHLQPLTRWAVSLWPAAQGGFWSVFRDWWHAQGLPRFGIAKMRRFDLFQQFLRTPESGLQPDIVARLLEKWLFQRLCFDRLSSRRGGGFAAGFADGGKLPVTRARLHIWAGSCLDTLPEAGRWAVWRFQFNPLDPYAPAYKRPEPWLFLRTAPQNPADIAFVGRCEERGR